ncbi:helix-turn-helix DNA binding domain protein [Mycobacterium phage JackSparrow]|uniref:sigma-K factor n=1 Tax=Mycobacterium phage Nerujay TaxID=1647308 RepID=UPI000624B606|nr:sigma-K factor [Mycobacterium phage Nerujay]AKF14816.1 ECF RNA polymerase sigma factor [Mycobacterium phage Nerujay]QFP96743.1 helix-turn-helix DNA binding domain protein [Mycobacterium phage JackSparrow]
MADTGPLISKAARSIGNSYLLTPDQVEDLVQDLWVSILERSTSRRLVEESGDDVGFNTLRVLADQILKDQWFADDLARGDWNYSSESIKDALKGRSDNVYLMEVIPQAVSQLVDRHPPYAEALKVRYIDGVVLRDNPNKMVLKRAHHALAEEVHKVIKQTDDHDGPGSRSKVFPDSIRSHNGPGDPVGEMATRLADDGWKSAGEDGLTYRELFDLATAEQVTSSAPKHRRACPVCHHIVPISSGRFRDHLIPSCAGSGAAA